ncbi:hypothetical protein MBLNU457_5852t1 [Dothideomycetes sp. NU457]
MPPKRRPAPTTAPPEPKKRVSKLAKENNLTSAQETEIHSAYALFSTPAPADLETKHPILRTSDIRRVLIALNTPPTTSAELAEITSTLDPEGAGYVEYEPFVAVAALKLHQHANRDEDETRAEVEEAFALFTRGERDVISLADLRRVARELREEVGDAVLRDMVREATGGKVERGVTIEEFEGVMRRAGVF